MKRGALSSTVVGLHLLTAERGHVQQVRLWGGPPKGGTRSLQEQSPTQLHQLCWVNGGAGATGVVQWMRYGN